MEFAEHKEYVSGEDIGNIDWRVYGRTKRLFVRQYKEETDMVVYLLVDTSASMQYKGAGLGHEAPARAENRRRALVPDDPPGRQGVAHALLRTRCASSCPPSGTRRHLYNLLGELEAVAPSSTTDVGGAVRECASLFKKRGCLVILSDFLGETEGLFDALGQFLHRRYEVLLLQVIDPEELDLPNVSVARFVDMESGEQIEVEPEEIREAYREHMEGFIADLAERSNRRHLRHALIDTRAPYLQAIEAWLGFRGHVRR